MKPIGLLILPLMHTTSCKPNKFESGGAAAYQSTTTTTMPQIFSERPLDTTPTQSADMPTGLSENNGVLSAFPDLGKCASIAGQGKVNYGQQQRCQDGSVLVVVNDGTAKEQTCCPLPGTNIFSKNSSELYVQRTGRCGPDEVGVGMIDPESSSLFCSKINSEHLSLSSPQAAIYAARSSSGISDALRVLAGSYNNRDTCVCPDGFILIGGHSPQDNICTDQCVQIVSRR
jgi:hypothetical protein